MATPEKDGIDRRYYAAAGGTKGYRWYEAEVLKALDISDKIDKSYSRVFVDAAIDTISKFGDYHAFAG